MTIAEAVRNAARTLETSGIDSPALDAEVLMRHLLGWNRAAYLVHRNEPLDPAMAQQFALLTERRAKREPIAYIVGNREFLGLDFAVGPGALVPRPETEQLVEWAAAWLAGKEAMIAVDVGTGSGAIAIGIARSAPAGSLARIIAVDPSADALFWARKNAETLISGETQIDFIHGSLLDQIDGPIDLVLANLPYLTPAQTDENPDLAMEPRSALVSGADGLDLIRELLVDLSRVLSPVGAAILELDPSQAETVAALARAAIPDATVAIVRDLSGRDRFVTIER